MQLPILIEAVPNGRFRARLGEPFHVDAEADDAQRAVEDLVQLLERRLQGGAKIAVLTLSDGAVQASLLPFHADDAYRTDWVYQELMDGMAESRRLEDSMGP